MAKAYDLSRATAFRFARQISASPPQTQPRSYSAYTPSPLQHSAQAREFEQMTRVGCLAHEPIAFPSQPTSFDVRLLPSSSWDDLPQRDHMRAAAREILANFNRRQRSVNHYASLSLTCCRQLSAFCVGESPCNLAYPTYTCVTNTHG